MLFDKNISNSRKTSINIIYEGKNITKDLKDSLLSCSQSDSLNELDSLELSLENKEMLWMNSWYPKKGETLKVIQTLENWENEGVILQHDMGLFYIDTIDYSGPPDIVNIKAISFDLNSDIVDKKENKVWENVDFKTIVNEIGKNRNLEVFCDISFNRKYSRLEQKLQSDFDFLKTICEEIGIKFKLFNDKIVIFEEETYEKKDSKVTFYKEMLESYHFSTEDTDSYSSCTISYFDFRKKKKVEKKFKIKSRNSYKKRNKRNLFINEDKHIAGKNEQEIEKQLLEIAKKALREKNKKEEKGSINFMGTEQLLSVGDTININDFGSFSGKYLIESLRTDLLGYNVSANIHKVLDMDLEMEE